PPPSEACAAGTIPAATAADAPPEDPPGERVRSCGLRVGPCSAGLVVAFIPNSGLLVLPTITAPAARNRRTIRLSVSATTSANRRDPSVDGRPVTSAPRS